MPEPGTARRPTNTRRSSKRVTSSPSGSATFDPRSVHDRIKQWQVHGAADAQDPDTLSSYNPPRSDVCLTPDRSEAGTPAERHARSSPRKNSTRWVRSDSTHWVKERKRRSREPTDRSRDPHGEPLNSPPSAYCNDEELRASNISHSRAEREERRRRRRDARALLAGGRKHEDDGIRVYAPSEPSHAAEEQVETDELSNRPAASDDRSQTQREDNFDFEDNGNANCHPDADEDKTFHQPSKYAQTLGRPPEAVSRKPESKSKRRDLLSKTKEILVGKPDEPAPISNRLPSIAAWLEEQPDPFVEEHEPTKADAADVQQPLKLPSRPKRNSLNTSVVEDPNKIWNSVSPPQRPTQDASKPDRLSSRKRSHTKNPERRKFSFEVLDADNKEEPSPPPPDYSEHQNESPTTLRRRGARARKSTPRTASAAKSAAEPLVELQQPASPATPVEQSATKTDAKAKPLPQIPIVEDNESGKPLDFQTGQHSQGLKRKLTTHEDLMSVLSLPRARRSTRSVKNVAFHDKEGSKIAVQELLHGMHQDENIYNKELCTLVDGVTPVLLQSFLSKTDASAAADLFSSSQDDAHLTRSVIDMAVAVERLKSLHNRIPLDNADSLLAWAQTAQRPYSDYVKAWRLGFQDVVVNLAPLNDTTAAQDDGLARDIDGDAIGTAGQKVDVAYLQKRPLVRLKRLSRLFCSLQDLLPNNAQAAKMATVYADLTDLARRRHRAEQGRLEDEAAARIDTVRVRDIRSLAPLVSVKVDPKRRVRARDCFNMTVYHSSGQRMDCRIEIIIRDNQDSSSPGGDVLICQVEDEGQWLLFAPVELGKISARRGEGGCDLVIMIRGTAGLREEWSELLALQSEDPEAAVEWMHMLGSNPLPSKLSRVPTYMSRKKTDVPQPQLETTPEIVAPSALTAGALSSLPSDVDVPIGEPSELGQRRRRTSRPASAQRSVESQEKALPKLSLGGGLQRKHLPEHYQAQAAREQRYQSASSVHSSDRSTISGVTASVVQSATRSQVSQYSSGIVRSDISHSDISQSRYSPQKIPIQRSHPPGTHDGKESSAGGRARPKSHAGPETIPLMSGALQDSSHEANLDATIHPTRPVLHHRVASTPEGQLPSISRSRGHKKSQSTSTPLTESIRDQWSAISGMARRFRNQPSTPDKPVASGDQSPLSGVFTEDVPKFAGKGVEASVTPTSEHTPVLPPPPPPHEPRSPPKQRSGGESSQPGTPTPRHVIRPSSSPLKNEYAPSSRSTSRSRSSADDSDSTSDTSDDLGSEFEDQAMPLMPIGVNKQRFSKTGLQPPSSMPSTGTRTLQPSDSASQGPYRQAPPPSAYPAEKKKRTIASVCSWSDKGTWVPIQDDECSIVVSPGLIQAFPITEAHSQPLGGAEWQQEGHGDKAPQEPPLVEFELTINVPLRKGTALDLTIRSPPTSNSKVQTTNNIMFRSRSAQECERLYNMINWARANNPTYAALARSRAREPPAVTFATNVEDTKTRSWFSFGSRNKSRYRASSAPPSSMGESAKSSGTTASAFSALKRFGVNSPFSLNRSSVVRRPGLGTVDSLYSSSSGSGPSSGPSSTAAPSQAGFVPGKDGPNVPATSAEAASGAGMVNNMKIRLFVRVGQKWDALGACSLTVLPAVTGAIGADKSPSLPGSAPTTPPASRQPSIAPLSAPAQRMPRLASADMTPHRLHLDGREKRILITKHKNSSVVILDEILGESCFEKVMQTGIAINVWKESLDVGVMTGRNRMYMMQFQTSSEAGWVFGMCGSFRYGDAVAT